MRVALNHDGGGNAQQALLLATARLFGKLVNHHGRGVGQFVAGQAKQFFAHGLRGQKLLAAVGQLVLGVPPRLLGQVFFANAQHALNVFGVFGRHRYKFGKLVALLHLLQPRRNVGAAIDLIELIGHQQRGHFFAQQFQHFGIGLVEHAGFDHEQNQIHVTHGAQHGFVQRAVQRIVVPGLKTGRIDKHKLRHALRVHAGDAVARGLGLARGDADFLPDQRIHQR